MKVIRLRLRAHGYLRVHYADAARRGLSIDASFREPSSRDPFRSRKDRDALRLYAVYPMQISSRRERVLLGLDVLSDRFQARNPLYELYFSAAPARRSL